MIAFLLGMVCGGCVALAAVCVAAVVLTKAALRKGLML